MTKSLNVTLISTYDLGHQPFGLASLAAWLRAEDANVTCNDTSVSPLAEDAVRASGLICIHLAMHTATRLALELLPRIRALNGNAHLCFFGLYGPPNAEILADYGPCSIIGGEFEAEIASLYRRLVSGDNPPANAVTVSTNKLAFRAPDRSGLAHLDQYASLGIGPETRIAGYTEASRGCKHVCRHCPIVPIYGGRFRTVPVDVVLADIRGQVAAGAQHISFGDPDFFNGPGHAKRVIDAFHEEFPEITFDATIKIEHLLSQQHRLAWLRQCGCLFVTTAVEATDDHILEILDKGHSRADFITAAKLAREAGLVLSPTFVPFTPWTSLAGYRDLLQLILELGLAAQVAPVQLAIRLLVPAGSLLLDHPQMPATKFAPEQLSHPWRNPDPAVDALQRTLAAEVEAGEAQGLNRFEIFAQLWRLTHAALGLAAAPISLDAAGPEIPQMSEPWYCCAEPTELQRARL
jgi:radical SAM superfamily enzyme YgiQ (UPF0313 family)